MTTYLYYINHDDRGCFYADVRRDDEEGETIYEVFSDTAETLYEDGFISDPRNADEIEDYLKHVGILNADDELLPA